MVETYDNKLMSNFCLWLDNYILTKGQAFTNVDSNFYRAGTTFNGYYTYSAPFSQFVADGSVNGANVPTGVYLDGSFVGKGASGFIDFDYGRGYAYFNTDIVGANRVSGRYAVKDFNVEMTSEPEQTILFETKYSLKSKTAQTPTGQANDEISYPIILVRPDGSKNEPFALGGQDLTCNYVSLYVITDSQYKLDGAMSLLRDAQDRNIPLLERAEMPFNVFGGFKTGVFNYDTATAGKVVNGSGAFISRVSVAKFDRNLLSTVEKLNPDVYFGICDVEINRARYPRIEV
jgi:hypothetical protein